MQDFDITWRSPSKAQEAALAIALKRKVKALTEVEVAELICLAQHSLWFTQAKSWAETPPIAEPAAMIWAAACRLIVEIVESGYNEESGMWWDMAKREKGEAARDMLILMDFGMMLKQYRQRSLAVVSQGFTFFIEFVCGRNWESRYRKTMKAMADAAAKACFQSGIDLSEMEIVSVEAREADK